MQVQPRTAQQELHLGRLLTRGILRVLLRLVVRHGAVGDVQAPLARPLLALLNLWQGWWGQEEASVSETSCANAGEEA